MIVSLLYTKGETESGRKKLTFADNCVIIKKISEMSACNHIGKARTYKQKGKCV